MTSNPHTIPGSSFHWLRAGVIYKTRKAEPGHLDFSSTSEISTRGQVVTITAALLEACPWLDLLGDEQAQLAKWGEIRIAPGDWPTDLDPWTPGTREEGEAYDRERREAWGRPVGPERDSALVALRERWGNGLSTSRTLKHVTGDTPPTVAQPRERVRF